jgi:hypothetical protein
MGACLFEEFSRLKATWADNPKSSNIRKQQERNGPGGSMTETTQAMFDTILNKTSHEATRGSATRRGC